MRALCWHGNGDIRCETVPDPKIEDGRDAIIKVPSCAICGSDLHLLGGFVPNMQSGYVLGHETIGEVVEAGSAAKQKLKAGDRVVVPFTISCGASAPSSGIPTHRRVFMLYRDSKKIRKSNQENSRRSPLARGTPSIF